MDRKFVEITAYNLISKQISKLEWFLKDRVTLRTREMMLKIQLCITGINYILKYIHIEISSFKM